MCRPVGDKLLDINDLERFLRENLKVQGKTGNLVHASCVSVSVLVGGCCWRMCCMEIIICTVNLFTRRLLLQGGGDRG